MKRRLFIRFNNISLVYKIMIILGVALIFLFSVYLFSLNIIIREYNKILYEEKAANIKFAVTSLETKMREIDKISRDILVNENIQKRAVELYETKEGDRIPVIKRELYNSLLTFNFSNDYIKNIEFVSGTGNIISTGERLNRDLFDSKDIIKSVNGNRIWITSKEGDAVNAREIRKIKYMSLDDLGELYIAVDFYKMLKDSFQEIGYNINPESLLVKGKNVTLYPTEVTYKEDEIDLITNELAEKKYIIKNMSSGKKFILKGEISDTKWDYFYFADYNNIFQGIQTSLVSVLTFNIIASVLTFIIAYKIVKSLCNHLILLIKRIKKFGISKKTEKNENYKNRRDEIGKLHQAFDNMTASIALLEDENYKKQILLKDTRLKMLQQQINPHFLYNTLDTVNWMAISLGSEEISTIVSSLGALLRTSISNEKDIISLSEELGILEDYINIQKIRYRNKFICHIDVADEMRGLKLPKLCIQPLVENAVKYALENDEEVCNVYIKTFKDSDYCYLSVSNTGSQFPKEVMEKIKKSEKIGDGLSIGLNNINKRLKLLYGDEYGIKLFNREDMATVVIMIPGETCLDY